jgi:hypothetical protein
VPATAVLPEDAVTENLFVLTFKSLATSRVLVSDVAPADSAAKVVAPVTSRVDDIVVAPVTPSVDDRVEAPATAKVPATSVLPEVTATLV